MNYYNQIKEELINNEIYKKTKDYSKNKSDLQTYYNVGKLLSEADSRYGEQIIKKYSNKLINEVGKKYNERTLRRIKQFYIIVKNEKWSTLSTILSWSHYVELLPLKDTSKINYYIKIFIEQNLTVRDLRNKIKNNEYERLDNKTKKKLINKEENNIEDFIKHPIMIKNKNNIDINNLSEKLLKQLILEDIENFMRELGDGYSYIDKEYKIKIGNRYNYIDLLLFNYKFNCFVVVELKVTELRKEHIGQIETYMNYINLNIKNISQDKTIGIIICKEGNSFIMKYVSDKRIFKTNYILT